MSEIIVTPLFSCPLSQNILQDCDSKGILNHISKIKYKKTAHSLTNEDQTNVYRSESIKVLNELPKLKKNIELHLKAYVDNVLKLHHLKYKITTSWSTLTPPEGMSQRHQHVNSWISGIFYPQSSPCSIRFYSPIKPSFKFDMPNEFTVLNSITWDIEPQENMLLIFNSFLEHSIIKNTSGSDRYSIAFNVFPYGRIGAEESILDIL